MFSDILGKNTQGIKIEITYIAIWLLLALCPLMLLASSGPTHPDQTPPWAVGLDFGMGYLISLDGTIVTTPEHKNLGGHVKYFADNNLALGLRFSADIERDQPRATRWIIGPEITYQWFQSQTWMPYVRSSLPVILRGAPNTLNAHNKKTLGFSASFGLAWNLGKKMGVERMLISYDFGATYYFKIKDSIKNFGLDLARFGIEVRF